MKKFIATVLTLSSLATPVCLSASAFKWSWKKEEPSACEILNNTIEEYSKYIKMKDFISVEKNKPGYGTTVMKCFNALDEFIKDVISGMDQYNVYESGKSIQLKDCHKMLPRFSDKQCSELFCDIGTSILTRSTKDGLYLRLCNVVSKEDAKAFLDKIHNNFDSKYLKESRIEL